MSWRSSSISVIGASSASRTSVLVPTPSLGSLECRSRGRPFCAMRPSATSAARAVAEFIARCIGTFQPTAACSTRSGCPATPGRVVYPDRFPGCAPLSLRADVQSQRPIAPRVPLAGRRHERREGHPHPPATARQLFSAQLDCFVDLGPRQKGAHMSRFEEVVNDAIGEVVLGESALPRRDARAAHRREGPRPPGRLPRRGHIEARYPEHKPAPVSGIETQEIYTLLGAAVRPSGDAAADRRRRPGHDRVPVRADARRRRARASGCAATASPTTRSSGSSRPCLSRPTTSAASGRCTSAARRPATTTSTPSGC